MEAMQGTIDLTNNDDSNSNGGSNDEAVAHSTQHCLFTIPGNPIATPRSRYFKNGIFNPKKTDSANFRKEVLLAIPQAQNGILFEKGTPLKMTVKFFL